MTNSKLRKSLLQEVDSILDDNETARKALDYIRKLRTENKTNSQPAEQALIFSPHLSKDINMACQELDNGEYSDNTTINNEVEEWLKK